MRVEDVFKKSFMQGFGSPDINIYTIITSLLFTCVLAAYIFVVYRIITKKTFYSKSFNISLAIMAIITSGVILTVQSSIVVSLGMVGALSIVRFRTAIKDPMDLIFLFWSMSVGIICGAGFAEIAIILSVLVTVAVVVLNLVPVAKAPMILVINASNADSEKPIIVEVNKYAKYMKVKSRNMTAYTMDMIIELRTSKASELIKAIVAVDGVVSASLISHDGEVTF